VGSLLLLRLTWLDLGQGSLLNSRIWLEGGQNKSRGQWKRRGEGRQRNNSITISRGHREKNTIEGRKNREGSERRKKRKDVNAIIKIGHKSKQSDKEKRKGTNNDQEL